MQPDENAEIIDIRGRNVAPVASASPVPAHDTLNQLSESNSTKMLSVD